MTEPKRDGFSDNRYQMCKCSECGTEARCTPDFDFYVRLENQESKLLTCEICILKPYRSHPVIARNPDGSIHTEASAN